MSSRTGATITAIVAVIGLVVIEVVALAQHIDGQVASLVVAAVAGLGGYTLAKKEHS